MVKQFYLTRTGTTTPARVDLKVMLLNEYLTLPYAAELGPHHQMV